MTDSSGHGDQLKTILAPDKTYDNSTDNFFLEWHLATTESFD